MDEDTLDQRIENAIAEVEYHLKKLDIDKPARLLDYVMLNVLVNKFSPPEEHGPAIAQITVSTITEVLTYGQVSRDETGAMTQLVPKECETLREYWDHFLKNALKNKSKEYCLRALFTLEFIENIRRNTDTNQWKLEKNIVRSAEELYDIFAEASNEKNEEDWCPVKRGTIKAEAPELKNIHSIQIRNLVKNIFLNKKVYEQLLEHARQGNFAYRKPFKTDWVTEIRYE